jgi:hypothetical protein
MAGHSPNRGLRKFLIGFAGLGFLLGVVIWVYSEVSARSLHPVNIRLWTVFIALCPPSLLSIPFIDVEPGTFDFTTMWFVIALINAGLYGVVGWLLSKLALVVWKVRNND